MSFITLPTITQDKALDVDYYSLIKSDLDDHETRLSDLVSGQIPNGSFESYNPVSPYDPTNWTWSASGSGGTRGTHATGSAHGARRAWITHPGGAGNGGGYYESDYTPCEESSLFGLHWNHYATVAGMNNLVEVRWYDKDKVYLSTTTPYDSTANPTTNTPMLAIHSPPSNARFFKVRAWGGKTGVDTGGTAYYDGFQVQFYGICGECWVPAIAQQSTVAGSWEDKGSVVLPVWVRANTHLVAFSFTAECIATAGDAVAQRFRIGQLYSNETTTAAISWSPFRYTISGSIPTAGQLTLVQQIYRYSGSSGIEYGRLSAPAGGRVAVVS